MTISVLSKVCIGISFFIVLTCTGRAKIININLEQMNDEELVQELADPKWKDSAFKEITRRLKENNYDQHSELARLLFHNWKTSDNEKLRRLCFQGLRLVKSQEAVDVLITQLLQGSTRRERISAAYDLGEIGNASAVPALESAVRADKGVFGEGRSIARESIFALGKIGSAAVPTLMRIWNDKVLRQDCEEAVISAMGQTKDSRFTSVLIEVLEGKDEPIRDNAAWALGEIKDKASLPKLRKYQLDSNKKVRESALEAIRKIEQRK